MIEIKLQFVDAAAAAAFLAAAAGGALAAVTAVGPASAAPKPGKGSIAATPAAASASASKQEPAASPAPAAEPAAPKVVKYEDSGIGPLVAQLVDANRAGEVKALLTEFKAQDANGKISAKFLKPEQFDDFKASAAALLAKKPEDLG